MKICIGLNPNSYPPSAVDFNSNFFYNYVLGVICCHDGRVFIYNANELIDEDLYAAYVKSINLKVSQSLMLNGLPLSQ